MEKVRELSSIRKAYGNTLVDLGKENPDIVVLDADLSPSTMTHYFCQRIPAAVLRLRHCRAEYDGHCRRAGCFR